MTSADARGQIIDKFKGHVAGRFKLSRFARRGLPDRVPFPRAPLPPSHPLPICLTTSPSPSPSTKQTPAIMPTEKETQDLDDVS